MKKTIAKWLLLTALIAGAVFLTVWSGQRASAAMCKGIEVVVKSDDQRLISSTKNGVYNEVLRFDSHLLKKRASAINTLALERHLATISNFETVHCMITAQGKLRITVTPMIPALRVFDGEKSYYVNKDGKWISANAEFFADVPVVRGSFSKEFPPTSLLPVVNYVHNDSDLSHLVAMYEAGDADNIILVPRITGHVINLGDTLNLPRKKRALMAFYRKVLPYKGWNTYDTISVKFLGQVVATRRDKSAAAHSAVADEEIDLEEAALIAHDNPHPAAEGEQAQNPSPTH
ncbi:MAG: hypothetical protein U0L83_09675 [Muribaculaceae bacterium]|nr:hypothetical protein [Muribaculaceae bacterium]